MRPKKSYIIWFSQRNGSTLLSKGLEQTEIAGKPRELFTLLENDTLCQTYKVATYEQLKEKLWELGSSENGVFGIKTSIYAKVFKNIIQEIAELRGLGKNEISESEILADIFPNCQHIYLTRRNKIRQAVSWWKAIKDDVWHLTAKDNHTEQASFYESQYNFDALHHLFREATLRECAMQAYFTRNKIIPITLVYEDFTVDYENTIKRIIEFLGLPSNSLIVEEKFYKKTATELSEIWVQRFRKDLQAKMGVETW